MCDRETLTRSLYFRHACKRFDPERKLPEADLRFILEAARLAPSAFGMEAWRFLVIRDPELKATLRPVCWDQPQITECSDLVVILGQIASVADPEYYSAMFRRRGLSEEATRAYIRRYEEYIGKLHSIQGWVAKQCYIAADHMMVYASLIGVDSCPIEGFEPRKVDKILGLDRKKERSVLLLPLGYRLQEPREKKRRPFEEVVTFL
ncbi:NAD(P)H-dependent oxidoreductase [Nitratifractor salsuginis]|uniref:Nitroreductase n=1 Tax=Nitratifractor salsuginis (strain DSM 16511 / JCM 12458 / E9I37-1) TaxID=749222 RepID=E6WXY2_NITSE|nr:NAD(P)H-dependent oxidoreductase [Nitratifractor salsuginis]ADV45303.1 nitroreductase [Nitratifractor salsuginis DSM 16511]